MTEALARYVDGHPEGFWCLAIAAIVAFTTCVIALWAMTTDMIERVLVSRAHWSFVARRGRDDGKSELVEEGHDRGG